MPAPVVGEGLVVGPDFVVGGAVEGGVASTPRTAGLGASVDASVRLQALDGTWETCGSDRAIGVDPETLTYSHNEWGADKASFDLHRSPIALWPDLGAFTPVEIEVGGVIVWEGRTSETPSRAGAEQVINVQCAGWQYHLDDDVYQRPYAHSKLTDWKDVRSSLAADLTIWPSAWQVQVGDGAIVLTVPKDTVAATGQAVGVFLDLGSAAARTITLLDASNAGFTVGEYTVYVRTGQSPELRTAGYEEALNWDPGAAGGPMQATVATPGRYVAIFLYRNGASATAATDQTIKFSAVSVYADPSYQSEGGSRLHASTIVADALERATLLLSADLSQIAATSFAIPDFTLSKQSTPREAIEAANAYHNYIAKLLSGRRVSYQPRPTDPLLEIGAWSGAEIEDASANNGAEIYSRALVEAQGPDGSPLAVERSAAQQPGVLFIATTEPAPDNPSFTTNAASWTASVGVLTRTTEAPRSAPGAGKWEVGEPTTATLTEIFTGIFRKGVPYKATIYVKQTAGKNGLKLALGTSSDNAVGQPSVSPEGAYEALTLTWTPREDQTGVTLVLTFVKAIGGGASTFVVDDLALAVAAPTLADRRGFRRTKVIQMSSAITPAEGNQLADIFLQGHMTTPFKGAVAVSPGGVRKVLGGQPVHPSQLGLHAQELLRVSHMTDPDTGGVGRDGTIAEVSYTHRDQEAQVTLDDKRGNFDALLARLAVVQSVGS